MYRGSLHTMVAWADSYLLHQHFFHTCRTERVSSLHSHESLIEVPCLTEIFNTVCKFRRNLRVNIYLYGFLFFDVLGCWASSSFSRYFNSFLVTPCITVGLFSKKCPIFPLTFQIWYLLLYANAFSSSNIPPHSSLSFLDTGIINLFILFFVAKPVLNILDFFSVRWKKHLVFSTY